MSSKGESSLYIGKETQRNVRGTNGNEEGEEMLILRRSMSSSMVLLIILLSLVGVVSLIFLIGLCIVLFYTLRRRRRHKQRPALPINNPPKLPSPTLPSVEDELFSHSDVRTQRNSSRTTSATNTPRLFEFQMQMKPRPPMVNDSAMSSSKDVSLSEEKEKKIISSETDDFTAIAKKMETFGATIKTMKVCGSVAVMASFFRYPGHKTILFYCRCDEMKKDKRRDVMRSAQCVLDALEAILKSEKEVNLKVILEESDVIGSIGMTNLLSQKQEFLSSVDAVCVIDGSHQTSLARGSAGFVFFDLSIECAKADLHSGMFGGSVPEAMADLTWILAQIHDHKEYEVSLHGIQGAFDTAGEKTVIPGKVIGKFSIRFLHPNNEKDLERKVKELLEKIWKSRNSPNKIQLSVLLSSETVLLDLRNECCLTMQKAANMIMSHNLEITEETSHPLISLLMKISKGNMVICRMGAGQPDDRRHSEMERCQKDERMTGKELLVTFLNELAK